MKLFKRVMAVVMAVSIFAGCSRSEAPADDSSREKETITVQHALGTVEVPANPERVATIAWCNQDVPLALGIVPVGISKMNFAADRDGMHPWTRAAFEELGVELPNIYDDIDGWDYEAIADSEPDVILAGYSGLTQEEYDRLSEIAPVVAYPREPWVSTWREQTLINAEALGKKDEAEVLIRDTEKLISDTLEKYPDVKGKSVAFCWLSADDLGTFYIYTTKDPRAAYLEDLGMVVPESVRKLSEGTNDFSLTISAENADQFNDIDIIVTYGDEKLVEALQADSRLSVIPAVRNGAIVLLDSTSPIAAASTPSILSIPYALDTYLSMYEKAALKVK